MSSKQQKGEAGGGSRRIRLPAVSDRPEPQAANWFLFSFAGDQVQLILGYLDVHEIALVIQGQAQTASVTPEIVARFSMSMSSFATLRNQVNAISNKMIENGVPLDEMKGIVGPAQ